MIEHFKKIDDGSKSLLPLSFSHLNEFAFYRERWALRRIFGDVEPAHLEGMYAALRTERTGLRIALLASDPELYSNRRLLEAGEERGHRMEFLNVKQCYMRLDPQNPEMHYRGGNVLERIDAVIPHGRDRSVPCLSLWSLSLV